MTRKIVDIAVIIPRRRLAPAYGKDEGIIPDGLKIIDEINAQRKSPIKPIERPGRTRKLQSRWLRRPDHDAG
jgi:hypothetical protein